MRLLQLWTNSNKDIVQLILTHSCKKIIGYKVIIPL